MSDSAAPTPPEAPEDDTTTPPAIPPIKPGIKTSEAWFTLILMILGWLPSSGLLASSPLALQIVGLAFSFLSGSHYIAQRSSLKRTIADANAAIEKHYTYAHFATAFAESLKTPAKVALLVLGLGLGAATLGGQVGCGGSGATLAGDIKAGGSAFLACEKQNLTKYVPGLGVLIAVVASDLASGDYAGLVASLIDKVGSDAVGCAVVAIDAIAKATTTAAAATPTPSASMPIATAYIVQSRAAELMTRYGWKIPPPPLPQ